MIEPAASLRLQRVRDAHASCAPDRPAPARDAAVPLDRAVEPPLGDGYPAFRDGALAAPAVASALLATIAAQAGALALVWEAHLRGAAPLPPAVADAVRGALRAGRPATG